MSSQFVLCTVFILFICLFGMGHLSALLQTETIILLSDFDHVAISMKLAINKFAFNCQPCYHQPCYLFGVIGLTGKPFCICNIYLNKFIWVHEWTHMSWYNLRDQCETFSCGWEKLTEPSTYQLCIFIRSWL